MIISPLKETGAAFCSRSEPRRASFRFRRTGSDVEWRKIVRVQIGMIRIALVKRRVKGAARKPRRLLVSTCRGGSRFFSAARERIIWTLCCLGDLETGRIICGSKQRATTASTLYTRPVTPCCHSAGLRDLG